MRFHLKDDGTPGVCKAKPGECPKSAALHGDSVEEIYEQIAQNNQIIVSLKKVAQQQSKLVEIFETFREGLADHMVSLAAGQRNKDNAQESFLAELLEKEGFIRKESSNAKQYRKAILDPLTDEYIKTDEPNWFIEQPYGSQSPPDFLVNFNGTVVPIELKSNKGVDATPFWNGHLPSEIGVYLVTDGKPEATFFLVPTMSRPQRKSFC